MIGCQNTRRAKITAFYEKSHRMQRSRLIIGVMGGDGCRDAARRLGAAITSCGHIILTGGRNQDTDAVKDAALSGAASYASLNDRVARMIGIFPGGSPAWEAQISVHERSFFLDTGLTSPERDCITGTTPDALIILCGSTGTLTETAFAELAGRPLMFLGSKNHLKQKREQHGGREGDGKLEAFFRDASAMYAQLAGCNSTTAELHSALDRSLANSPELPEGSEDMAVAETIRSAARLFGQEASFPGLPCNPQSTSQCFYEMVRKIEQ